MNIARTAVPIARCSALTAVLPSRLLRYMPANHCRFAVGAWTCNLLRSKRPHVAKDSRSFFAATFDNKATSSKMVAMSSNSARRLPAIYFAILEVVFQVGQGGPSPHCCAHKKTASQRFFCAYEPRTGFSSRSAARE